MNNIELVQKISSAAQDYYSGKSTLSDKEFDSLVSTLHIQEPNHPILNAIGWGYLPVGENKELHKTLVGSLDKVRHNEVTHILLIGKPIATPKLDGGSAVCHYKSGFLQKIVSRGNGTEGINITANLIHAVPLQIKNPLSEEFTVRGEIVLTLEDFAMIGGSSARNKAVGLSQRKFPDSETKKLKFIAYSINWTLSTITLSKIDQLTYLSDNGFRIPSVNYIKSSEELESFYKKATILSPNETIQIDGVVLTENTTAFSKEPTGYRIENDSIAVKFEEEIGVAAILDIEWSVNRTGRVVPVAVITPTELSGAIITRATCYNYGFLKDYRIGIGAIVKLIRANEVIPKIIETIKPAKFDRPIFCPLCKSKLEFSQTGIDLTCPNIDCPAKLENSLIRLFELTKPDGLGTVNIDKLIELLIGRPENLTFFHMMQKMNAIIDLYKADPNYIRRIIYSNFGEHIGNCIDEMFKTILIYQPKISDIIYISNIPMVGDVTGEKLNALSSSEFMEMLQNKSSKNTYGIFRSEISLSNFRLYSNKIVAVMQLFNNRIKEEKVISLEKWNVAVTGKLSTTRENWYKLHPALVECDINKTTKYLVTNEVSNSSKYQNAIKSGVPILSEIEFEKIYKEKLS